MSQRLAIRRVVGPTLGTACISSLIAIMVNLATEWRTSLAAWGVVVLLTLASAATSLVLWQRQMGAERTHSDDQTGVAEIQAKRRLTIDGSDIHGDRRSTVKSGDDATIRGSSLTAGSWRPAPSPSNLQPPPDSDEGTTPQGS